MIKKPLHAAYFVNIESVVRNRDGSWILTYNTIGGRDDRISNAAHFDKSFTFPSGKTIDALIPGFNYVIRYKIHNNVMSYESAFEVTIIEEIT